MVINVSKFVIFTNFYSLVIKNAIKYDEIIKNLNLCRDQIFASASIMINSECAFVEIDMSIKSITSKIRIEVERKIL